MKDPQNIRDLAEFLPDYMGFIFYPESPRYAGRLNSKIVRELPDAIKRIGVFVNEAPEEIYKKYGEYGFDYIQLHGGESVEECREVAGFCPVIKAVNVYNSSDIGNAVDKYGDMAEYLLFDTKTPLYGGSGQKFDWSVLADYTGNKKYFLSGGIRPEDVDRIKNFNSDRIHSLDLNSRFESEPGVKDIQKLRTFINEIRNEQDK